MTKIGRLIFFTVSLSLVFFSSAYPSGSKALSLFRSDSARTGVYHPEKPISGKLRGRGTSRRRGHHPGSRE